MDLENRHGKENLEQRLLSVSYGLDYVNVNYVHLCAHDLNLVTVRHRYVLLATIPSALITP